MKFAVAAYLRKIIAIFSSFILLLFPVDRPAEKPETTQPANSVLLHNLKFQALNFSDPVDGIRQNRQRWLQQRD